MPKGKEGRLIAKIFLFRAIYRGPAFSYAADPQFSHIGDQKFWQKTIDAFYEKYSGIKAYHERITQEVIDSGRLVMPTGRIYTFEPRLRGGEYQWPITDIANYPVQGFAADLMAIIRVNLASILRDSGLVGYLFCNTVHDSIVLDVDNNRDTWYNVCIGIDKAFKNTAINYETLFKEPLLVPMGCEIKVGYNWLWMHKIKLKGV
jgi:DNA polymerase I-like protein with 3'-5' exonuclease and polymerase domains